MRVAAGIGLSSKAQADELVALLERTLAEHRLAPADLVLLASIEEKADHPALKAVAARFEVPLRLFPKMTLSGEDVPTPSASVERHLGIASVAEAAALRCGRLLVGKQKSANATCAIAEFVS